MTPKAPTTPAPTRSRVPAKTISLWLLLAFPLFSQTNWLSAPVPDSPAVNQLRTSGNACGPACLLDSFRSGGEKWRKSLEKIPGDTDTKKIIAIIKGHANKSSRFDKTKSRWNPRAGISGADLADMANEMRTIGWMGTVKFKTLFRDNRQSSTDLLQRTHRSLAKSLKKGFPPIISIRRMAYRRIPNSQVKSWLSVKRHYVVLTGLPEKLPSNATSFQVTYHDPWGGKKLKGIIQIADANTHSLATLIATFPGSKIGKNLIKSGEPTILSFSSALGVF